jgi:hypothetical protein
MFLTREEIQELTNKQRPSAQVAVLNSLGIIYKLRPDGSLVVLKAHVEQLLGGQVTEQKPGSTWEPDWATFEAKEQASAAQRKAQQEAKRERINAARKSRGLGPLP